MQVFFKPITAAIITFSFFSVLPPQQHHQHSNPVTPKKEAPKIQVAVLLDVSNSMDGLIQQAKAQLWNMVSVMGKAECNNVSPTIEIALYEYGRSNNNPNDGYVKQINGFTNDLDQVSQNLFGLTTNGGDEYCGHVMYNSLTQMNWDSSSASYKVIFIAGNEEFLQGDISFSKACEEARKRNVIVNTIYCGNKVQGINEHWNLGSECGLGSFTNINQDAKLEEISTPYDSTLFVLNGRLNNTYVGYGSIGSSGFIAQEAADQQNYSLNKTAAAKRVAVKSQSNLYRNGSWDMVDAQKADSSFIRRLDKKDLPDSLRNKNTKELEQIVAQKTRERSAIQQEIASISAKRESYIAAERKKPSNTQTTPTLETEIEKIIRQQASRFNMTIRQ